VKINQADINNLNPVNMNIQHKSGETKGEFYLEENGEIKAKMTYTKLGNTQIIIDHTEVSDDLRGKDVGKKLVQKGVEYARKHNLKVIPLCPFAKATIERDKSLQDVLRK
jgi:uncharacterized protein